MSGNNLTQLFQSLTINEMSILYIENGHHVTYVKCPITTYVAVAKKSSSGIIFSSLLTDEGSLNPTYTRKYRSNGISNILSSCPTFGFPVYLIFYHHVPLLGSHYI